MLQETRSRRRPSHASGCRRRIFEVLCDFHHCNFGLSLANFSDADNRATSTTERDSQDRFALGRASLEFVTGRVWTRCAPLCALALEAMTMTEKLSYRAYFLSESDHIRYVRGFNSTDDASACAFADVMLAQSDYAAIE